MEAMFAGVEFSRTLSRFIKRKGNSSCYVHILYKTSHWRVSRRSRAVDVKGICQKHDARAELLFCS